MSTDVTKDLLEALRDLIDSHWLHDSHAVEFDGTVMFSPHYDFSGIDGYRRSEFRDDGIEFVVWPAGGAGRKWSAYSTYEGSMWFEKFDSEAEARAVCMKLLADVMPDHSVSRALAAIARAEAAMAEPQPDAESAMTRADVLRLALEAGFTWEPINNIADPLERFATLVLEADDGPWKAAVIDQLVIAHILTAEHESDPLKAIQDLLAYHADIAVDPRVSGAAAKLVEQARAEEREACLRCYSPDDTATDWADRIKARGQK